MANKLTRKQERKQTQGRRVFTRGPAGPHARSLKTFARESGSQARERRRFIAWIKDALKD